MSRDIWVIADTHFGHHNIIGYCDRPFETVEEMDQTMVDNWNRVVKPGDIVYHLGDVYCPGGRGTEYWGSFMARLKGRKRLILGNHDAGKDIILHRTFQKISGWRMFPEFGLLLTHVPVHESSFAETPSRPAMINVHGHTHQRGSPTERHRSACVELIGYTPMNIEELRIR